MLKGPKGEKRKADVIGNAFHVMRTAKGEIDDATPDDGKDKATQALGATGGKKRTEGMAAERHAEIAKKAASVCWNR